MAMKKSKKRFVLVLVITLIIAGFGIYNPLSAGNDSTYEGLKLFADVIDLIEKNYVDEVDSKELILKAIQGMVGSLDPHSNFMPPEAFEELKVDTHGSFGGIGIVITMKQGVITVIAPIQGTPAYEAGIMAGDRIVKVDGESTEGMMLWEAVKKMRGKKGTAVVITVMRKGEEKPIDFSLIRDIIPVESVKYATLSEGYGYIWITNFNEKTAEDLEHALTRLMHENKVLKGLILDLRDNPGGLLSQAVKVSDIFLDKGVIVSIKGRQKRHNQVFKATANGKLPRFNMVVLINGGSASASEIVAGALKDNKRALLLGTTSFGKGSVQTVESLRGGYGLKFTIARYYTPSGQSIQAEGIKPDIVVAPGRAEEKVAEPGLIKEKDLKNHLEAEDLKTDQDKEKKEKSLRQKRVESKHVPLDLATIRTDRQVKRGLEILKAYDILSKSGR